MREDYNHNIHVERSIDMIEHRLQSIASGIEEVLDRLDDMEQTIVSLTPTRKKGKLWVVGTPHPNPHLDSWPRRRQRRQGLYNFAREYLGNFFIAGCDEAEPTYTFEPWKDADE